MVSLDVHSQLPLQASRAPAGMVLSSEATGMVLLAISVVFVHEGQSLKPEAFFCKLHLDRGLEVTSA